MSRASLRYAKAILEQAVSKGSADRVNDEMNSIVETVRGNREFSAFLGSPVIKLDDKEAVVGKVFAGFSEVTISLFRLLLENKRFGLLEDIAREYNRQYRVMNNIETVQVTTAVPMDKAMEEKVLAKVRTFTDKQLIVENIVDPEIIGGFILRIEDKQFNASVASKLKALKREFALN